MPQKKIKTDEKIRIQKIPDFNYKHRWIEDLKRIQKIFRENGYQADLKDCEELWEDYCDDMCAGWICLPEDDEELWNILKNRAEL